MGVDIALTERHDLQLADDGDLVLLDGAARVAQQIKITLLAFLGEWFLDTGFGVPYLEHVLVKGPQRALLESIFRSRIAEVPGVLRVRSIELFIDHPQRLLAVAFEAETRFGRVAGRQSLTGRQGAAT